MSAGSALALRSAPSGQIVTGFVGVGLRGLQLLKACLTDPGVRIGAVCETYEPRMFGAAAIARTAGNKTRYYRLFRDLISDREMDAVVIATPDFSHHVIASAALEAGKHVYLEQPVCLTPEQGADLIKIAEKSGRTVQVGSQRRSSPLVLAAATTVASGAVGTVRIVNASRTASSLRPGVLGRGGIKLTEPLNFSDWLSGASPPVPFSVDRFQNWRYYSAYGGGAVTSLGVHLLDGIHTVTGASYPITVKASGAPCTVEGFDTAQSASIVIEYPGGQIVSLNLDGVATEQREQATIEATKGRLDVTAHDDSTRAHLRNFFDSIRSGRAPRAPLRVVFAATLICQMASLAIRTGETVHWDAEASRIR